jgi:hypothetical protein
VKKAKMSATSIGQRVQELVVGIVMAVVLLSVGVALGPTVISAAAEINATSLASVPLASVLVFLATYISFFYYLGIVLGSIAIIWAYAQFHK